MSVVIAQSAPESVEVRHYLLVAPGAALALVRVFRLPGHMKVSEGNELGRFQLRTLGFNRWHELLLGRGGLQLGFLYFIDQGRRLGIGASYLRVFWVDDALSLGWKCSGRQLTPVGIFWRLPSQVTSRTIRHRPSLLGRESTWRRVYSIGQQVSTGC